MVMLARGGARHIMVVGLLTTFGSGFGAGFHLIQGP